jgi:hypothetical protein
MVPLVPFSQHYLESLIKGCKQPLGCVLVRQALDRYAHKVFLTAKKNGHAFGSTITFHSYQLLSAANAAYLVQT